MVRKGIFYSLDALIAVILILSVLVLVPAFYFEKKSSTQPIFFSSDIIQVLSTLKIGELNDTDIKDLIDSSNITDTNITIIEQMLVFQVTGHEDKARELLNITLHSLLPDYYNMGVWIEDYDDPVYVSNQIPVSELITSKQMISGIEKEKIINGVSSRVVLSGIDDQPSSYVYFGGYIGDGAISVNLTLPSQIDIISADMELDAGSDFKLYINGIYSGDYMISSGKLTADYWEIDPIYLDNFNTGPNILLFNFNNTNMSYIGGGFFRVKYTTSEINMYDDPGYKRYFFPSVQGIINIYDSFYVPGILNFMKVHLHYSSNHTLYLTIGNKTVINDTEHGDAVKDLENSQLSDLLDYSALNKKTIPIKLSIGMLPLNELWRGESDTILITDLSASMDFAMGSNVLGVERVCEDPLLFDPTTKRISVAKCLDKLFVDITLNNKNNAIGLVGFNDNLESVLLSNDAAQLKAEIDKYSPNGGTCLCCAINEAYNILDTYGSDLKMKYIVILTDGVSTHDCMPGKYINGMDPAINCVGTEIVGDQPDLCLGDRPQDCVGDNCKCPVYNANWSACRANQDLNAIIHAFGIGPVETCDVLVSNLKGIAECGKGSYLVSRFVLHLKAIYERTAVAIALIGYKNQTGIFYANASNTTLYLDSYIELNYTPSLPPSEYGKFPVTIESPQFGNNISEGTIDIPDQVQVYDAKVYSYSGEKWTDKAHIKNIDNITFFNLSQYSDNYYRLGDPFIVNIPIEHIQKGENIISVSTGLSPEISTGGSPQDRVVYTAGIDFDVNYTGIFGKAEGCKWSVTFEDNSSDDIFVPSDYDGDNVCVFDQNTDCDVNYNDDSINNAVCHLFKQLDFDNDGKLFLKIGPNDLKVETYLTGSKIPYLWGPTTAEVRVWR